MTAGFAFNEKSHEYSRGGVAIPSCTQLIAHAGLTNFENVKQDILERRSRLGRIVHKCTHFLDEGDLDLKTVASEAKGYVESWALLCEDLHITKWNKIEFRCVAAVDSMEFGMQIDREGMVYGSEAIVDIKISRSVEKYHGVQVAGYAAGLPHQTLQSPSARFIRRRRYIAKLNEQGKRAQLIPFESRLDYDIFRAALLISHAKLSWNKKLSPVEMEEEWAALA